MTRVVVVGHGMVGARFVDDLHARDSQKRFTTTVLGAEEYEPYNRVLLSDVVAGRMDVASIALPRGSHKAGHEVLPGMTAVLIDRTVRTVTDQAGEEHAYDVLVQAAGARARVPDLFGRRGADDLPAGAHALRTLDDAREIVAATVNARRAVVVGGGVLGLEVACGLAGRGLHVTVVHGGAHLMDRQLDAAAASVATARLTALGVSVRVGARTEEAIVRGGRITGVRLEAGETIPADLLVLTAGTVAEVDLAQRAGLDVARGIVVGDDLATLADHRVFAIGDCAQPPEGGSGLIAQGWDQARRLATRLTASTPEEALPSVGTDVVKVKGAGLDVVTMGVCGVPRGEAVPGRRVQLSDPDGGRHIEVVVDDGRVIGATCVGAGAVAADLVAAYTRGTPAPLDPAQLLLRPVAGSAVPAASPVKMPDRAVICRCNGVTKGDIVGCWRHGSRSVEDVAATTRATTGCGGCKDAVCGIVDWLKQTDPDQPAQAREPAAAR